MAATKAFFPPMATDDQTGATEFPAQQMDAAQAALAFAADAIPGDKVDLSNDLAASDVAGVSIPTTVGFQTIPIVLEVNVANGASADVGTWTAPFDCRIVGVAALKTDGNGGAGDLFEIEDAAGGAGNNIATTSLNDTDTSFITGSTIIDDARTDIASGTTIHFRRVAGGATNNACRAYVSFIREA